MTKDDGSGPRPGIDLVGTRWGRMYAFANDQGVSEALRRFGEYAAEEIALYRRLLADGDTVVDVGCNIGVVARALTTGAPRVSVFGFEPQPDCYRLAVANTLDREGATVYPLAAADAAGTVTVGEIDLRRAGNYGALAADAGRGQPRGLPCPAIRLDEFLAIRAPAPRLVKIDAEGMEAAVIAGLAGLAHERLVVSAETDRRGLAPAVLAALQALGCRCYAAYFRPIAADNPRFDPDSRHCRNLHVHLLGFAGPPPDWIEGARGVWPIRTATEFDELWGKYLPADAAPG